MSLPPKASPRPIGEVPARYLQQHDVYPAASVQPGVRGPRRAGQRQNGQSVLPPVSRPSMVNTLSEKPPISYRPGTAVFSAAGA